MQADPLRPTRLRDYLELVRPANLFTAPADSLMGFWFVRAVDDLRAGVTLGLLALSSVLLYAAGVVLNDLFDLQTDRQERPERPLPSGRIAPAAAAWLGAELLILGLAVAFLASFLAGSLAPGAVAAGLSAGILLYDAAAKRTMVGPLVMGTCRGLNVLMGMAVAWSTWQREHLLVAGAIGLYVAGLTWFARSETARSRRGALLGAAALMAGAILLLAALPLVSDRLVGLAAGRLDFWPVAILLLGLLILRRFLWAVIDPSAGRVQIAVRSGILSLVVLDAAICAAARGLAAALVILGLLVPGVWLARRFNPT